jgi:hypothetical protein
VAVASKVWEVVKVPGSNSRRAGHPRSKEVAALLGLCDNYCWMALLVIPYLHLLHVKICTKIWN